VVLVDKFFFILFTGREMPDLLPGNWRGGLPADVHPPGPSLCGENFTDRPGGKEKNPGFT